MLIPAGETLVFGTDNPDPMVTIQVTHNDFFKRIVFSGDVGLGEAYTAGNWNSDDPVALLMLLIQNRKHLERQGILQSIMAGLRLIQQILAANTFSGSRRNIRAHYDLGNDFFEVFLDRDSSDVFLCRVSLRRINPWKKHKKTKSEI